MLANSWRSNENPSQLLPAEIDAESELMQALAEIDEMNVLMTGQWRYIQMTSTLGEQEVAPR